jgi:hypothetical protein
LCVYSDKNSVTFIKLLYSMKKTLLLIASFVLTLNIFAQCNPGQFSVALTCTAPTIDGDTTDVIWKIAPAITMTKVMNADPASLYQEGSPLGRQQLDNPAGHWRALYDGQYLYFLVVVYDTNPVNNRANNYWAGDGVEIFLASTTKYGQYGFGYAVGTPKTYTNGSANFSSIQSVIKNFTGGYALEVRIPYTSIALPANATDIKMECGINQSNSGNARSAQILTWTTSNTLFSSSANYTDVPMSDCGKVLKVQTNLTGNILCNGSSVNLTTTTAGIPTGENYTWEENNGSGWVNVNVADVTQTITDSPTTNTQYHVIYDGIYSCPATVTIATVPTMSSVVIGAENCSTLTRVLTATAASGKPQYQYSLNGGTYQTSNLFTVSSSGDYNITIKDANSCLSTPSDTTVTITSLPIVTLTANPTTAALTRCASDNTPLSLLAAPNIESTTPIVSYTWTKNGTDITASTSYNLTPSELSTPATLTYEVKGVGADCPSLPVDLTITINANPIVTLATNPAAASLTRCATDSTALSLVATPTTGSISNYSWSKGGVALDETAATYALTTQDFTTTGATVYEVIGTGTNNCSSAPVDLTVNVNPAIAIKLVANPTEVQSLGQAVTLNAQIQDGSGTPTTYTWVGIVNGTNNSATQTQTPLKTTTYAVTATDGVCSDKDSVTIQVSTTLPTAITPYDRSKGNDIFAKSRGTELIVFNNYGITVYKESVSDALDLQGWNGCWNGDLGKEVEPGTYFYVLTTSSDKLKGTIEVVKTK